MNILNRASSVLVEILQASLKQSSPEQQQACIEALALMGTPAALQVLAQGAHDDQEEALRSALWSSWQHSPQPWEYGRLVLVPLLGEQEQLTVADEVTARAVVTLEGLQHARTLKKLDLSGCVGVWDLTPLAGLSQLEELSLKNCVGVRDLTPLAGLSQLKWLDVSKAHLRGSRLSLDVCACLAGADLRGADLSGANLRGADLSGANLRGALLRGTNLSQAMLFQTNLCRTNLENACLAGADLTGVDLRAALLRNTNLTNARMTGANLRRADLENACLAGADLTGADLRGIAWQLIRDLTLSHPGIILTNIRWDQPLFLKILKK